MRTSGGPGVRRVAARAAVACATVVSVASASAQPRATDVEAPGPLAALRGALQGPSAAGTPLVLFVPGSGPTDRDGNGPNGLATSSYRLLADGLAARGIATVRIDKRGLFGSAAAIADANDVDLAGYAADVRSWVDTLRRQRDVRCVWVAGHSEGGLVAMTAGRDESGICGWILIAAPGRPLGTVLRDQLRANPANAPLLPQAFGAIDALEAGREVDVAPLHPALQALFHPKVQRLFISEFAVDPATLIGTLKRPVLIVQGGRDLQVPVEDARRLQAALPRATLVVVPEANHVLKAVATDDRAANVATYADPARPLAPGIVDAIAGFIDGARSTRR